MASMGLKSVLRQDHRQTRQEDLRVNTEDELYEARRTVARAECSAHGHSYQILATLGGGPKQITCDQEGVGCGAGPWIVLEKGEGRCAICGEPGAMCGECEYG